MARSYDMYRADFEKGAFCSAIGGACASDEDLENGFFQNPAALVAHANDWNFDGDYGGSSNHEPGMKGADAVRESRYMFGAGFSRTNWGYGFSFTGRKDSANSDVSTYDQNGNPETARLTTTNSLSMFNFAAGRKIGPQIFAGAGFTTMRFDQSLALENPVAVASNKPRSFPGLGVSIGAINNISKRIRAGSWFRTSLVAHNNVKIAVRPVLTPVDYSENMALTMPWMLANGISYMPWADARTFFFDINLIGNTPGGYQLTNDTFASLLSDRRLRAKGRAVSVEPRLGYRTPWPTNSKLTFLAGSYYEGSRWDGLPGRIHLTGGAAYKTFKWLELMGGVDVAKNFFQLFLTFR